MPVVHSCRVHLARVSRQSCPRQNWASATLYTLAESFQFWRVTRGDSQVRHETLWLVHHGLLKNETLTRRDYSRGCKARVPIYILALALSRVPLARVYGRHYIFVVPPRIITFYDWNYSNSALYHTCHVSSKSWYFCPYVCIYTQRHDSTLCSGM